MSNEKTKEGVDVRQQPGVIQPPMPLVLKDDDGIRPAGRPDQCFYCGQRVGQPHKPDCVCLHRIVKVRYSYDIEIEVPHGWNEHDIEFHRNESSWCADNSFDELEKFSEKVGGAGQCFCERFKAEVLEIPEALPYRYNKDHEVVV